MTSEVVRSRSPRAKVKSEGKAGTDKPRTEKTRRSYHHGDLRGALIAAGESLIAKEGLEGFSLRACAKEVGVSSAAPAHHFGNASGLLEAIATEGFRSLSDRMSAAAQAHGPSSATGRLAAMARAYIDFALERPGAFRVTFGRAPRPSISDNQDLKTASDRAFALLSDEIRRTSTTTDDRALLGRTLLAWSFVHGLASLLADQRLGFLMSEDGEGHDQASLIDLVIGEFERSLAVRPATVGGA